MIFTKITDRLKSEFDYFYFAFKTEFIYNKRDAIGILSSKPDSDFCDLAVVAFNNAKVIEYQIRCIKKFFTFPYRYTVFDNSKDNSLANEIKQVCIKYNVAYVRLPKQDFLNVNDGSYSHGIAINYLITRYIIDGGAKYFGLLDHDIFPVVKFDISHYLEKQFFYGRKHGLYIWPGFFFIRMDYLKNHRFDFRPSLHLRGDTGVINSKSLFMGIDWSKFLLVDEEKRCFGEHNDIFEFGYSYFSCGWVHCWNASNYMKKDSIDYKMEMIYQMLEKKLC